MSAKSTIILIWLAGDEGSVIQLDPLLEEIQRGVNDWDPSQPPPDVYCLYHHALRDEPIQTDWFRIGRGTLEFTKTRLLATVEAHARRLNGPLAGQIAQFIREVARLLIADGPIHVIFAAHGMAGRGLNPVSDPLDLRPGGTESAESRAGTSQSEVAVPFDDARAALMQLPVQRLHTLILHSCNLSGLEAISALRCFPHHIACQTQLALQMRIGSWFSALGNPAASPQEISDACFASLRSGNDGAQGRFSSHRTKGIDEILGQLDEVGDQLLPLLRRQGNQAFVDDMRRIWGQSSVAMNTLDAVEFCQRLKETRRVPERLLDSVIERVRGLQLNKPVLTQQWLLGAPAPFEGINLFLPSFGQRTPPTSELPESFRSGARRWCEFVDAWSGA